MPLYMYQLSYAPEAVQALVREPQDRIEAVRPAIEALGGKLVAAGYPFGEYDGLLKDGNVVLNIADSFNSSYRFSASQLETYIACPFQFFCRYVLKLEPAEPLPTSYGQDIYYRIGGWLGEDGISAAAAGTAPLRRQAWP